MGNKENSNIDDNINNNLNDIKNNNTNSSTNRFIIRQRKNGTSGRQKNRLVLQKRTI